MKSITPTLLLNCLILTTVFASTHLQAGKKIIKWVDSTGVTHYGDSPPMPEKARQSSVLNKQGITIEKIDNQPEKSVEVVEESQASEAQKRYDHALINSYGSVAEIELARKRNIKIDELALESLQQKQNKLQTMVTSNKQSNSAELSALQNLDLQIKLKEKAIAATNERYTKDKQRYRELTSQD